MYIINTKKQNEKDRSRIRRPDGFGERSVQDERRCPFSLVRRDENRKKREEKETGEGVPATDAAAAAAVRDSPNIRTRVLDHMFQARGPWRSSAGGGAADD